MLCKYCGEPIKNERDHDCDDVLNNQDDDILDLKQRVRNGEKVNIRRSW
jgi:hypothetical protein